MLCYKWADVGLECTGTETHDDDTENENAEGSVWFSDCSWGGRGNEDNVTKNSHANTTADGLVTTKVRIGQVSTCERGNVVPELVDYFWSVSVFLTWKEMARLKGTHTSCQTSRCTLAFTESTGLRLGVMRVESGTTSSTRIWLLDEVDDCDSG